jgi:hypothetical protein
MEDGRQDRGEQTESRHLRPLSGLASQPLLTLSRATLSRKGQEGLASPAMTRGEGVLIYGCGRCGVVVVCAGVIVCVTSVSLSILFSAWRYHVSLPFLPPD